MEFNRALSPFPFTIGKLNNISSPGYRDTDTFANILHRIAEYIAEQQIPEIQEIMNKCLEEFQKGVTNAENTVIASKEEWQQLFDTFMGNVTAEIKRLNDESISEMVEDPKTLTGIALRLHFADKAVQTLTETGRLSQSNLDTRYTNKTSNDITVAGINTEIGKSNTEIGLLKTRATNLETWKGTATTDISAKIPLTQRATASGVATLDTTTRIPSDQLRETSKRGTYLARPAANTVPNGYTYHAYDVMESYISDGAGWFLTNYGGIFGTAKILNKFESRNNGPIVGGLDVPGMNVTFTAGSRPIEIALSATLSNTFGNCMTTAAVMVDGVFANLFLKSWQGAIAEKWMSVSGERIQSYAPGSVHTAKVQLWWDDNSGSGAKALMDAHSTLTIRSV